MGAGFLFLLRLSQLLCRARWLPLLPRLRTSRARQHSQIIQEGPSTSRFPRTSSKRPRRLPAPTLEHPRRSIQEEGRFTRASLSPPPPYRERSASSRSSPTTPPTSSPPRQSCTPSASHRRSRPPSRRPACDRARSRWTSTRPQRSCDDSRRARRQTVHSRQAGGHGARGEP